MITSAIFGTGSNAGPEGHTFPESGDVAIRMRVQMTGNRDGQLWPAPGGTLVVSNDEARLLVGDGMAVVVEVESATISAPEAAAMPRPSKRASKPLTTKSIEG